MSSTAALTRRIDRILEQIDRKQPVDLLALPEWEVMRSTIMQAVTAFPDAERAVLGAFTQLEQRKPLEWKAIQETIYRALEPYMPARVAIASALMEMEKAA